jgi:hypothetical protein
MKININKNEFKKVYTKWCLAELSRNWLNETEAVIDVEVHPASISEDENFLIVKFPRSAHGFSRKFLAKKLKVKSIVTGKWGNTQFICGI